MSRFISFYNDDEDEVEVSLSEVFDEIEDQELVDEIVSRGYYVDVKKEDVLKDLTDRQLHQAICDIFGVNHHTPTGDLLYMLGDKLKKFNTYAV